MPAERTPGRDVSIRIENVSKTYQLGEDRSPGMLSERIGALLRRPFRRGSPTPELGVARETLHALSEVSAELRRGEAVGLVGRNGAGKSTLLKLMSRITLPTEGRITIEGRVATLLEVGTGFHPELTGRQNVFLNGSILGMRRREIEAKFDEIVDFSGVERFLDTPVKRYSSGMYVRLAFAVAAHLDPEIMLVDEVLAVGDQEFQKKCLGKMQGVAGEGRTVVFVSHNLNAIQRLCDRALLLERGRLLDEGTPAEVVAAYLDRVEPEQAGGTAVMTDDVDTRPGSGEAHLRRAAMSDTAGNTINSIHLGQRFRLTLEYDVYEPLETAIEIGIWTLDGQRIASALSVDRGGPPIPLDPGRAQVTVEYEGITFVPGDYYISVHLRRVSMPPVDYVERALRFTALNVAEEGPHRYRWPVLASVSPVTRWTLEQESGRSRQATASIER